MIKRKTFTWTWLCLGLAGCTLFEEEIQPPCPQAATVADAQVMTAHRPGPGRDLTDVLVDGSIVGVTTGCEYDEEGRVSVTVALDLDLSIGPAAQDNTGQWEYFVMVANPDLEFIAKRIFTVSLKFEQAVFRTRLEENVTTAFDYAPWSDARKHRIFVGFQLTRDQLNYIRGLKR